MRKHSLFSTPNVNENEAHGKAFRVPAFAGFLAIAGFFVACQPNSLLESIKQKVNAPEGSVAAPEITPTGGAYYSSQQVTIKCSTPGSVIHFTIDGSTPTISTNTYSAPITVNGVGTKTVKAVGIKKGMNDSPVSEVTLTIMLVLPPSGLEVIGTTSSSVSLSWNASEGATSYWVCRGLPVGGLGYADTGLAPGTTHFYFVSATSTSAASALSTVVSGTTMSGGGVSPATPGGLRVTASTNSSISLAWDASANAANYQLYCCSSPIYFGNSTMYTHAGLALGSVYTYTVGASNAFGTVSALSSEVVVPFGSPGPIPGGPQPDPTTPTGLRLWTTSSALLISWDPPSGSILLYRDGWQVSFTNFTDIGLASGTRYSYTVCAANSNGNSTPPAVVSVTVP
jgi:hypothetical protein